jgi:hypothetical protein
VRIPIIAAAIVAALVAVALVTCPGLKPAETSADSPVGESGSGLSSSSTAQIQQHVQTPAPKADKARLPRLNGPKGTLKISNQTGSSLTVEISDPVSKGLGHYLDFQGLPDRDETSYTLPIGSSSIELRPGRYHIAVSSNCGRQNDNVRVSSGSMQSETYYCEQRFYH